MSSGSVIGTRNWHKDIRNYWSSSKHTDLPILTNNVEALKFANSTSTRFLTSRSFLTLSNARISYDLPKSLMKHLGINSASVYLSGDNLFLISARKGYAAMTSLNGGSGTNRYLSYRPSLLGLVSASNSSHLLYIYIYYAYKHKNLRRGRTRPTCALGLSEGLPRSRPLNSSGRSISPKTSPAH